MKAIKKAQNGATKKPKLLTVSRTRQVADSLDNEASRKRDNAFYTTINKNVSQKDWEKRNSDWNKRADKDESNAKRYRKLADVAEKKKKNGGSVKAKDGKWIQKAINPAHKGYCTPMTKATCTPKRKALAKTLRKISKKK